MSDDLFEQWQANKDRPAWVQENRDALMQETGVHIPSSRAEIASWLSSGHKGTVTRRLKGEDEE